MGPDGTVYVASEASTSPDAGVVSVSRSEDGGRTWTSSELPGVTAFAFEPAIAVDAHGTVGITWYDLRNDRRGDATLTTDVWFARSRDQGATWRQEHLAGPFDLRTAPNNRLGEYQGLAGLRRGLRRRVHHVPARGRGRAQRRVRRPCRDLRPRRGDRSPEDDGSE